LATFLSALTLRWASSTEARVVITTAPGEEDLEKIH
jgi:hypothetical protein